MSKTTTGALIQTNDGVSLFHQEWGTGKPILFVHAWAMNSDEWQYNVADFADRGFRCISFDRRGHGRSDRPNGGYEFDRLVDDLATVVDQLDLHDVTLVAHSLGTIEAIGYLAKYGTARVSRLVLLAPTAPYMTQTEDNPDGLPKEALEAVRASWRRDFPAWLLEGADDFYRADPPVSRGIIDWTIDMMRATPLHVATACGLVVAETDLREPLKQLRLPTLVIHGTADASSPVVMGRNTAKLVPSAKYIEYVGAPHGLFYTHRERILADVCQWLASEELGADSSIP